MSLTQHFMPHQSTLCNQHNISVVIVAAVEKDVWWHYIPLLNHV